MPRPGGGGLGLGIEAVCGPATGGLIVAEWMAHALDILSLFTEHGDEPQGAALRGPFVLRRGYGEIVSGKRVLVVDDIVNTGLSMRETAAAVGSAGGVVVGGACLVSRSNVTASGLGLERFAYLLEYKIPTWPEVDCKLCREGVPVNIRYAHGGDYLAQRARRA